MIVIPPLEITTTEFTSSTSVDPFIASVYDSGVTYAIGTLVSVALPANYSLIYESLRPANVNNYPTTSPTWWKPTNYHEPVWDAGTSYTYIGQIVSYSNRVYSSLQATNLNNTPLTSPDWWEDVGPTNKWAMFDTLRNTATVCASPLTVVVTPGRRVNTVAALGVFADSIRVQVTSLGTSIYDETTELLTREVSTYYEYFFGPFIQTSAALFQDVPSYTDEIVTVTFTKASGSVNCGALVVGVEIYLGITEPNPVSDSLNFSTVDRSFDGTAEMTRRRTVPKTNQTVLAESSDLARIIDARTDLNAVPAVWAGLTDDTSDFFPSLLILGFYKQFQITLLKPDHARISLELEEI